MTLLFAATSGVVPIGLLFWLLLIFALIFGIWIGWPVPPNGWRPFGFNILLWILFFLLGLAVFGWPIAGR